MISKLIPSIQIIDDKIQQLNDKITHVHRLESHYESIQDEHQIKEIQRIHHLIFGDFQESINNVASTIKILEDLKNEMIVDQSKSDELQLPTKEKIQQMLKSFFEDKLKTRSSPIPNHCGCYAYKNKNMKEGNFICARIIMPDKKPHYHLYIVAKYANNICEAYDPEQAENELKLISLKDEDWTPLPVIFPERPIKRWEFSPDASVLSLFPEDDEWTTEFYPAKVLVSPSSRPPSEPRGYELQFEGSSSKHIVPEKFIVSKKWED